VGPTPGSSVVPRAKTISVSGHGAALDVGMANVCAAAAIVTTDATAVVTCLISPMSKS
jgi:hypothetical protein